MYVCVTCVCASCSRSLEEGVGFSGMGVYRWLWVLRTELKSSAWTTSALNWAISCPCLLNFLCWDRVSLNCLGCLWTHCVAQAGLELVILLPRPLSLQTCAPRPPTPQLLEPALGICLIYLTLDVCVAQGWVLLFGTKHLWEWWCMLHWCMLVFAQTVLYVQLLCTCGCYI